MVNITETDRRSSQEFVNALLKVSPGSCHIEGAWNLDMKTKSFMKRSYLRIVTGIAAMALTSVVITACGGNGDTGTAFLNDTEVATFPASDVTSTAATLNGWVSTDKYADTDVWFEWSFNPDISKFEFETPHASCPKGASFLYSIRLSGLVPETIYHYRIASNNFSVGATAFFTTSSVTP